MSLYGALFSGVTALAAQSQSIGAISDNIANVNTIGYKGTDTRFDTLVTVPTTATRYTPGGIEARPRPLIDRQGVLQASASPTDLAITGQGMFVINTSSDPIGSPGTYLYTRAGSFTTDASGNLRNTAGYYLQGYPIDATGNIPTNQSDPSVLRTVNVNGVAGTAEPTTTLGLQLNLQASQVPGAYVANGMSAGTTTPHFERSVAIVDSKGGNRTVTFGFFRDAALPANQWRAETYLRPATDSTTATGLLSSGIVAFNTNGTINTAATTLPTALTVNYAAALGLASNSITLDLGTDGTSTGLTQFDAPSTLTNSNVNGAVFGQLASVKVTEDGVVSVVFSNGRTKDIYKLPIATFRNPNGLENRNGNAYQATTEAGSINFQLAGAGGAGKVAPSALEGSTTDLANEFSNMILTQRAYSAASKVITTADELLDELIRIKR
jgi:flagellar hook protein FlgE